MHLPTLSWRHALLVVALFLAGCPGDAGNGTSETSTTGGTHSASAGSHSSSSAGSSHSASSSTGNASSATHSAASSSSNTGSGQTSSSGGDCGNNCYTVYAHGDYTLYKLDLTNQALLRIGDFHASPNGSGDEVITDLAVTPNGQLYGISQTDLYTMDPTTAQATWVGAITACGTFGVALTFSIFGELYTGDYSGAFCKIDLSVTPPTVVPVGTLSDGLALAGDLVAVSDGTMFGTAYRLNDSLTTEDNLLIRINPTTGEVLQTLGSTGFGRLFGVAFEQGRVFGFTHDGTGRVITMDPDTGQGTLYGTFVDPVTQVPITFAGAAVSPKVAKF